MNRVEKQGHEPELNTKLSVKSITTELLHVTTARLSLDYFGVIPSPSLGP